MIEHKKYRLEMWEKADETEALKSLNEACGDDSLFYCLKGVSVSSKKLDDRTYELELTGDSDFGLVGGVYVLVDSYLRSYFKIRRLEG